MLKRIEVENFKSLKHLDYSCAKLNLLMGLNGAGKSSFIQFLLFLRSFSQLPLTSVTRFRKGVAELPFKFDDSIYCYCDKSRRRIKFALEFCSRAPRDFGILDFEKNFRLMTYGKPVDTTSEDGRFTMSQYSPQSFEIVKYLCSDAVFDAKYVAEIQATEERQAQYEFLRTHNLVDEPDPEYQQELYKQYKPLEEAYEAKDKEIVAKINDIEKDKYSSFKDIWAGMKFVEAFRRKPQELYKGLGKTNYDFVDSEGRDIAEFLYNAGIDMALHQGNPMISPSCLDKLRLIDQVNAWLQVVSPGAQIRIDKREVDGEELFLQSVAFGRAGHEHGFKPQNVGFGISYVLPVLVALLTSIPEDIVIIENPEAHLHPRGQAEMGNLIARAAAYGIQVFVETHSDHVINGVRVAVKKGIVKPEDVNIAFFERKGHEIIAEDGGKRKEYYADVRNIKIDNNGSLSEYPEDFMDEWNNQLMRLMKPRKK